jgi:hypothetical protein
MLISENMNTELDKVKSTITVSLGLKNRLRDVKGGASYEEFIAQLLRSRNELAHGSNYLEIQKFQRREIVYSLDEIKVVFSYNRYNKSTNFIFDIQINTIRENGQKYLSIELLDVKIRGKSEPLVFGYDLYFKLLTLAIQNEIEPLFKHKGRFEDYYSWQKEFERLGLSKKAYENDVMEKLNDFKNGVHYK